MGSRRVIKGACIAVIPIDDRGELGWLGLSGPGEKEVLAVQISVNESKGRSVDWIITLGLEKHVQPWFHIRVEGL